ncbi:hypothetical protein VNI00_018168 [Paramarasmius palmivorus]|uniref:Uncharacterized protein n=1 Tax=Paramarasmius palmivorus TaxID=297713 RepID=A0AAW0B0T7_9AGAR
MEVQPNHYGSSEKSASSDELASFVTEPSFVPIPVVTITVSGASGLSVTRVVTNIPGGTDTSEAPNQPPKTSARIIAGAVLGGFAISVFIFIGFRLYHRRKKANERNFVIEPFPDSPNLNFRTKTGSSSDHNRGISISRQVMRHVDSGWRPSGGTTARSENIEELPPQYEAAL